MVVLSTNGEVTISSVPNHIVQDVEEIEGESHHRYDLNEVVKNTEKRIIKEVMEIAKGNKKKAAEILNIKRSTLYYKLNQYDLI